MDISTRLRLTIIRVLSKAAVHRISFSCGSRTVNSSLFTAVIDRLNKKKLHFVVDPDLDDEAQYSVDRGHTFVFSRPSYGQTDSEEGVMVHESVHAGFDVIGHGSHFPRIDNEPSAYLAESFFLLNSGFSFDEIRHVLSLQLAFTIALNMQSKKQHSVPPDDLVLLRNGIARIRINRHGDDTRKGTDDKYRGIAP